MSLVAFEFRQSVRLQTFRFSRDRIQGVSKFEPARLLTKFELNTTLGIVEFVPANWPDVQSLAERLSAQYTPAGGDRTLDVLHEETAVHCGAKAFITLDEKRRRWPRPRG